MTIIWTILWLTLACWLAYQVKHVEPKIPPTNREIITEIKIPTSGHAEPKIIFKEVL